MYIPSPWISQACCVDPTAPLTSSGHNDQNISPAQNRGIWGNGLLIPTVSPRKKSSSFTFLYPQGSSLSPREWSPRGPSLIAVQEYDNEAKAPNHIRRFLFANRSPLTRPEFPTSPANLKLPSLRSVHAQEPDGLSDSRKGPDQQDFSDAPGGARPKEGQGLRDQGRQRTCHPQPLEPGHLRPVRRHRPRRRSGPHDFDGLHRAAPIRSHANRRALCRIRSLEQTRQRAVSRVQQLR